MNNFQSTVNNIKFEGVPSSPYQYSEEIISELEILVSRIFPEDFKWYLINYGWRRIAFDHRSFLLLEREYLYHLKFESVEHQTFSVNRYQEFVKSTAIDLLPGNYYYPFGKMDGEINPSVSFQLLIDLNQENYGSVWAVEFLSFSSNNKKPYIAKIADRFKDFLGQVTANDKAKSKADENNEILFLHLLKNYVSSPRILPTVSKDPVQLMTIAFSNNIPIILDGARNVEFQYLANSSRIENAEKFAERASAFEQMNNSDWLKSNLGRTEIKVHYPKPYPHARFFKWGSNSYYLMAVESFVGKQNLFTEEFLFFQDKENGDWSILRRYSAMIADVKVKGVGIFAYDDTYKWRLKKKVKPAWSEIAANIYIEGEEDAITEPLINFSNELITNTSFKKNFEDYIFKYYNKEIYPEYMSLPEDERLYLKENYLRLNETRDIWKLLGKSLEIYIHNKVEFQIYTNCIWDEEHGLTLRINDWNIQ